MQKIYCSTVIAAPIADVWAIIRDFNGHEDWHPAIATSYIEGDKRSDQVGAIRNFTLIGGEKLREQLLSLCDKNYQFSYALIESEIALFDYMAEVQLYPITDNNACFWVWRSQFNTLAGEEESMIQLVTENVYRAGFEAVRARIIQ